MAIEVFDELPPPPEKGGAAQKGGVQVFDDLPPPAGSGDITVGNVARRFTHGLPFVGGFRDEVAAALQAAANKATGGAAYGTYEQNLATERARDRAFSEQHPVLDTALSAAGGVAGTVAAAPAVAGAGLVGAAGRTALGLGARALPGAIARGATAGGLQGLFAGLGDAEGGAADRGVGGLAGATIGAAAGALVPAVVGPAVSGVRSLYDRATGTGDMLSRMSAGARRYVGGIATPDALQRIEEGVGRLGREAMLADVSPEWNAVARGAAARPGGRDAIITPLEERAGRSNAAVQEALNKNLGPAPIPSRVEADIAQQAKTVGAGYDRALEGATRVNTDALAQRLDAQAINLRGDARTAVVQARQLLNIPGTDQLDPHPEAIHQVRQALDGMLETAKDTNVKRALQGARQEVDNLLAGSVPGIKQVDAQYADLMRQREALKRGQTLLDTGRDAAVRPQELADEMARNAGGANARLAQGLRAEVDRITGTAGNDALAVQRAMRGSEEAGDWNPRKLGLVFGQDPARNALEEIDRRVAFQNTRNQIAGGSPTAHTEQFSRAIDAVEQPLSGGVGTDVTATGLALNTLRRIHTVMVGALGQRRATRFASELGGMAVAQGATRDEFIAAMRRAGLNRAQIGRTLDMATRGGLIVSREAGRLLPERNQ